MRVQEVGPPGPRGLANSERAERHAPRPAAQVGKVEALRFELAGEGAGGGGDRYLVPGLLRAAREREDDPLGAARPELLDHVEDPHSSR